MSAAPIDLLDVPMEGAAARPAARRVAALLGGAAVLALAGVPGAFAVLLLMRPDLFLSY
jgi:hypothetical protein